MYQSFDAFEYVDYLRRRWRVAGIACGVAVLWSLPLSLLLPKRYTATASIVIEPPGNTDARTAIVVSPMYLESLKTYERFADSDSLFARAAEKFHLQAGGAAAAHRIVETRRAESFETPRYQDHGNQRDADGSEAGAERGAVSGRGNRIAEPQRECGRGSGIDHGRGEAGGCIRAAG